MGYRDGTPAGMCGTRRATWPATLLRLASLAVVFSALATLPAAATEPKSVATPDPARPPGTVITACFETWLPYQSIDASGRPRGHAVELAAKAIETLGHRVSFDPLPYKRCVARVQEGFVDMIVSSGGEDNLAISRVPKVDWVIGAVVAPERAQRGFAQMEDFRGLKVGIAAAFVFPPAVESFTGWTLHRNVDDYANLRMLGVRRLDVVLTDIIWAASLDTGEMKGLAIVPRPLFKVPQPDAFRPGLETFRDRYDAALAGLFNERTRGDILTEYGSQIRQILTLRPILAADGSPLGPEAAPPPKPGAADRTGKSGPGS